MNCQRPSLKVLVAFAALLAGTLASCQKTTKQTTAGGGASTQSVMTIKGAAR
jgi:hypothetical protein